MENCCRHEGTTKLADGWLFRRGPTIDFAWKRRWCVLWQDALEIYVDEACQQRVGSVLLGPRTRVIGFRAVSAPGDSIKHARERPNGFALSVEVGVRSQPRLLYFDASDSELLQKWTAAVAEAARAQAKASAAYVLQIFNRVRCKSARCRIYAAVLKETGSCKNADGRSESSTSCSSAADSVSTQAPSCVSVSPLTCESPRLSLASDDELATGVRGHIAGPLRQDVLEKMGQAFREMDPNESGRISRAWAFASFDFNLIHHFDEIDSCDAGFVTLPDLTDYFQDQRNMDCTDEDILDALGDIMTPRQPSSLQDLDKLMQSCFFDDSAWQKKHRTHLLREILMQHCELVTEKKPWAVQSFLSRVSTIFEPSPSLKRLSRLMRIRLKAKTSRGVAVLREVNVKDQKTGLVTPRNLVFTKKIEKGEDLDNALANALKVSLDMDLDWQSKHIKCEGKLITTEVRDSWNYPGLLSEYQVEEITLNILDTKSSEVAGKLGLPDGKKITTSETSLWGRVHRQWKWVAE